jgi:hypothetical protein
MMPYRTGPLVLLFAVAAFCPDATLAEEYKLYFLGGQSNMDGYGFEKELPKELAGEVEGVMIFTGNTAPDRVAPDGRGKWAPLRPGYGNGFQSDEKANHLSGRFGPELTFGRYLRKLNPDTKIAIIKYSRGGTSIDPAAPNAKGFGCWDPAFKGGKGKGQGINQYDHFLATVKNALAVRDIDGDGKEDRLVVAGIAWMQGESDAFTEPVAKRYEKNLKNVIDHIRRALVGDDAKATKLPVVIGRVADSVKEDGKRKMMAYGPIVREAQAAFVKKDGNAALVTSTDGYTFLDAWHYDTPSNIDFGRQFAAAMAELEK